MILHGDPNYQSSYKRPMDLLSSFFYIRYGEEEGKHCLLPKKEYFEFFDGGVFNIELLKEIGNTLSLKNSDSKLLDYHNDHSKLFFNTGRLILMGLVNEFFFERFKEFPQDNYTDEYRGLLIGLIDDYSELCYRQVKLMEKDFRSEDSVNTEIDSILNVGPFFSDDIRNLNHADILPIVNTGIFYCILGFVLGTLDNDQIKEIFNYGGDLKGVKGSAVLNKLSESYSVDHEKLHNFSQLCMIYGCITNYIEKSIGKEFNSRFTSLFKVVGEEFRKHYNSRLSNDDQVDILRDFDMVTNKDNFIHDRIIGLERLLLNPVSDYYVGDHIYDHRPLYLRQIMDGGSKYIPPLVKILEEPANLDYSNIVNYTETIDAHAYERAIKCVLCEIKNLYKSGISKTDYVISWYKVRYLDRLICKVFTHWRNAKTPFKIVGVDDMLVEVDVPGEGTKKEIRCINDIEYSKAIKRTMDTLLALNARYCEAQEYIHCEKWKRGTSDFNFEYYSKLEFMDLGHFDHDTILDAVRSVQYGKYPYFVAFGNYDERELKNEAVNGEINNNKLHKLDDLDKKYIDVNRSVSRTPYEIVKDDSLNTKLISGPVGEDHAGKIVEVINSLTNHEFLYLSL